MIKDKSKLNYGGTDERPGQPTTAGAMRSFMQQQQAGRPCLHALAEVVWFV